MTYCEISSRNSALSTNVVRLHYVSVYQIWTTAYLISTHRFKTSRLLNYWRSREIGRAVPTAISRQSAVLFWNPRYCFFYPWFFFQVIDPKSIKSNILQIRNVSLQYVFWHSFLARTYCSCMRWSFDGADQLARSRGWLERSSHSRPGDSNCALLFFSQIILY
jgi:hypothetical protein